MLRYFFTSIAPTVEKFTVLFLYTAIFCLDCQGFANKICIKIQLRQAELYFENSES